MNYDKFYFVYPNNIPFLGQNHRGEKVKRSNVKLGKLQPGTLRESNRVSMFRIYGR